MTTTFQEGAERNKALGIWGALGGSGAAAGVLFGGILTKYLGWEWIFFVNVPSARWCSRWRCRFVPESRPGSAIAASTLAGAVTSRAGSRSGVRDLEGARRRLGLGADDPAAARLRRAGGGSSILIESPLEPPLVPFSIFRIRSLLGANVVGFLLGAVIFANFFVLTLYVQQILGWSAVKTGVTFLATAGTVVIWAGVAQALATRYGPRPVIMIGMLDAGRRACSGTRSSRSDGHFWPDLLPAYLIFALGLAFGFVPVTIAALAQVAPRKPGSRRD